MVRTALLLAVLLLPTSMSSEEQVDLLARVDTFPVPFSDFLVRTRITSFENGRVVETALFDVFVSGPEKSLVLARRYRTKGLKLLYAAENMWVHLPNTHRPLRITPIQRLMGEASNGDVARLSLREDYSAELLGTKEVDGVPCHEILLTARKRSATYNTIILHARKGDYRPIRAEFFLLSGRHFKTAFYEEFRPLGEKLVLSRMTIHDALRKDRKTIFEYLSIEEKKLPAKYFNKNYLVHIKDL